MKIVQFITRMDVLGGAQMHVFDLTRELVLKGHQVTVFAAGTGKLTEELEQYDIPYIRLHHITVPIQPVKDMKAFFEVRKRIKQINPDLIATHSSKAGIIGRLVGTSLRIPTIFTAHSWSFSGVTTRRKRWLFMLIEKCIGMLTHGVITVSNYDYQLAAQKRIIPKAKMQMIHNGIRDYKPSGLQKKTPTYVRLLMVARFAEPKDHILLLRALQKVGTNYWTLTLVGDGPLLDKVKRFVRENKLSEHVFFLGERRDVTARLRFADVFVLISKSEGLPISIIEAMREGLPIIASDVGGVNELIEDQSSGLLVSKMDESKLTDALNALLMNALYRRELGRAAREKYEDQFTFHHMFRQTEKFYLENTGGEKIQKKRSEWA